MNEEVKALPECLKEFGEELRDLEKVDISRVVAISDKVGFFLVKGKYKRGNNDTTMGIKVNQIRRFLDSVRRIEATLKRGDFDQVKGSIILLRPKLAYAAGREEKIKPLMNVLDPAIQSGAKSRANFEKLLRLIEGIIAYHRFHGGSN